MAIPKLFQKTNHTPKAPSHDQLNKHYSTKEKMPYAHHTFLPRPAQKERLDTTSNHQYKSEETTNRQNYVVNYNRRKIQALTSKLEKLDMELKPHITFEAQLLEVIIKRNSIIEKLISENLYLKEEKSQLPEEKIKEKIYELTLLNSAMENYADQAKLMQEIPENALLKKLEETQNKIYNIYEQYMEIKKEIESSINKIRSKNFQN